ncbi:MAG TPA: ATP-binding protein [Steroidobacteraceae bacterium]|nr:ATP-binding protein [Steroidobacteraceae bacterium]
MNGSGTERLHKLVTVTVGVLLTLVMGVVLFVGSRLATRVTTDVRSLEAASGLEAYPAILNEQLSALRDRLEERAYSGQALMDLRATTESFTHDLERLDGTRPDSSSELADAVRMWHEYAPVLDPVTSFNGQPYVDTDSGSSLSRDGREYYTNVKRAQLFARENSTRLRTLLAAVASRLQAEATAEASRLRLLLSGGVLAALILGAAAAYLQVSRARGERVAREAQEQTRDILRTVKEGFFLLDADYRIGAVWSHALTRLFSRSDFAGLPFEDLLRDLVPAATLATATKYIKLLWGERAHENLMKSINPLGQLEIHVDNGHGGRDPRYLQFDFHRVMGPKGVKHVLVSVTDITSSVLLARELQESQENASAQVDMMMGVMHMDPVQLGGFLDATETGLTLVNTILKEPARTDGDFRKKLDGMFRELHSIKGEASAIGLMTVARRVHTLEDGVAELKKSAALSGSDFLPLVVKLDELMAHLKMVRELAARFSALRDAAPPSTAAAEPPARAGSSPQAVAGAPATAPGSAAAAATGTHATVRPSGADPVGARRAQELSQALQQLAGRLASDHHKKFRLEVSGLAEVPLVYGGLVKDILIQMVRNSAVHGIEPIEIRRAQSKDETGLIRIEFSRHPGAHELVIEDDGAGILPEQLRAAAVRRQLCSQVEADLMDTRTVMALIFRPGFTTQDEVSLDAGRGVGMDVVARSIHALGGKIAVSTNPGKFTRFRISLPPTAAGVDFAVA